MTTYRSTLSKCTELQFIKPLVLQTRSVCFVKVLFLSEFILQLGQFSVAILILKNSIVEVQFLSKNNMPSVYNLKAYLTSIILYLEYLSRISRTRSMCCIRKNAKLWSQRLPPKRNFRHTLTHVDVYLFLHSSLRHLTYPSAFIVAHSCFVYVHSELLRDPPTSRKARTNILCLLLHSCATLYTRDIYKSAGESERRAQKRARQGNGVKRLISRNFYPCGAAWGQHRGGLGR